MQGVRFHKQSSEPQGWAESTRDPNSFVQSSPDHSYCSHPAPTLYLNKEPELSGLGLRDSWEHLAQPDNQSWGLSAEGGVEQMRTQSQVERGWKFLFTKQSIPKGRRAPGGQAGGHELGFCPGKYGGEVSGLEPWELRGGAI